jgi:hypothetical protein
MSPKPIKMSRQSVAERERWPQPKRRRRMFMWISKDVGFACRWMLLCLLFTLSACAESSSLSPDRAETVSSVPAAAPQGDTADTKNEAASQASMFTELSVLASSPAESNSAGLQRYLDRYFPGGCEPDERFSVERICQSALDQESQDPSPWPQMLLAIDGERVVSAVLTDPNAALAAPWACETVREFEPVRLCFLSGADPADRARWSKEWAGFLQAAD